MFEASDCPATVGVMTPGEYYFETVFVEYVTVTSGQLHVQQPGESDWNVYGVNETFMVEKDVIFRVRTQIDSSYICLYR